MAAPVSLTFAILRSGGGAGAVGTVLACASLPFVLLLLPAGVVADRLVRRRLAMAADLVRAAVLAVMTALLAAGLSSVWRLAVLAAIWGIARAFFTPTVTGMVPELVAPESLQAANGARGVALSAGQAAGPALAGVAIGLISPAAGSALAALGYLGSALALARLPGRPRPARAASHPLDDLRRGWREVVTRPWCWSVIAGFGILHLLTYGPFLVLGPIVADRSLGGATAWGSLIALEGAGGIGGAILAGRLRLGHPLALCVALLTCSEVCLLVCFGQIAPLWLLGGLCLASGGALGLFGVVWETALQHAVPGEALSRVSAYDWLGSVALLPLGQALAAPEAAVLGVAGAFYLGAGASFLLGAAMLAVPGVRRLPGPGARLSLSDAVAAR